MKKTLTITESTLLSVVSTAESLRTLHFDKDKPSHWYAYNTVGCDPISVQLMEELNWMKCVFSFKDHLIVFDGNCLEDFYKDLKVKTLSDKTIEQFDIEQVWRIKSSMFNSFYFNQDKGLTTCLETFKTSVPVNVTCQSVEMDYPKKRIIEQVFDLLISDDLFLDIFYDTFEHEISGIFREDDYPFVEGETASHIRDSEDGISTGQS